MMPKGDLMKTVVRNSLLVFMVLLAAAASAKSDPIKDSYPDDVAAVGQAVREIFQSVRDGNLDELAARHLASEKFSKWPDDGRGAVMGFQETVEFETAMFSAVTKFEYEINQLKVDVIGPVAIATFVIPYEIGFGEESVSTAERGTLIFAKDDGIWKIVHEHFSPVAAQDLGGDK